MQVAGSFASCKRGAIKRIAKRNLRISAGNDQQPHLVSPLLPSVPPSVPPTQAYASTKAVGSLEQAELMVASSQLSPRLVGQQDLGLSDQDMVVVLSPQSTPQLDNSPAAEQNDELLSEEQSELLSEVVAAPVGNEDGREKSPFASFWNAYQYHLKENPIPVKSATSLVGFCLGDLVSQCFMQSPYDIVRTLRMMSFGVTMDGPIGHCWYTLLDKNIYPDNPTSNKAVITKTLLDQALWAPMFSCVFFAFQDTLKGHPEMVLVDISAKLLPMLLANYAVWPLAHIINFRFIPSSQRILYINIISIFWSAYMSWTANHS